LARTASKTPPRRAVWAVPRSLAATDGIAVCFLFLRLLRCFSSPGSPRHPMHSGADDPQSGPGFPIRRSQDHGSVTSSSGLIAGSHVLHRLSTPRHPPCALHRLITPTRSRPPTTDAPPSAGEPHRRDRSPSSRRHAQAVTQNATISISRLLSPRFTGRGTG
jgi:hypothetical protein